VRGYKASGTWRSTLVPFTRLLRTTLPKLTEVTASRATSNSESIQKKNDRGLPTTKVLDEYNSGHVSRCTWRDTPSNDGPKDGFGLRRPEWVSSHSRKIS